MNNRIVTPGDVFDGIPAQNWNSWNDAAEFVRDARNGRMADALTWNRANGIVRVKNSSGGDLGRFAIVAPSGILFSQSDRATEFYEDPVLTVTTPAAADQLKAWGVLQEPIKSGLVGRAMFIGITVCQLDVINSGDDFADAIAGDSLQVRSQPYGPASILYKESGTGTKWSVLCIGSPGFQILYGRNASAIPKNSTGTVEIYRGNTAGSETASAYFVSAYNWFGDIPANRPIVCAYIQRNWRIIAADVC